MSQTRLIVGRKKETSGRGKRPTRRATQREGKESCRRGNPNVLPVKSEEGRKLQGKPERQRKSTEEMKNKLGNGRTGHGEELPGRGMAEHQQ